MTQKGNQTHPGLSSTNRKKEIKGRPLREYWKTYGGFSSLFSSPYFVGALLLGSGVFGFIYSGGKWADEDLLVGAIMSASGNTHPL